MLVSPTQKIYILTKTQNQRLFSEEILPNAFDDTAPAPADRPRAIFLGGQSGSGKSGLAKYQLSRFPNAERAVVINSDALREYHPAFASLQKTDVNKASFLVNPDTISWQQKLIVAAIETGRNVILDGTLGGNPAPIQATINQLRGAGYFLQISLLSVPAYLSRFGIYKRYEDQVALKGIGRWVGMENHDRLFDEIPKTLALLETEKVIDEIQIFSRQAGPAPLLLYNNNLQGGQWHHPPEAVKALTEGRNSIPAHEEKKAYATAVQAVAEQMNKRGVSHDEITRFYQYVECLS